MPERDGEIEQVIERQRRCSHFWSWPVRSADNKWGWCMVKRCRRCGAVEGVS